MCLRRRRKKGIRPVPLKRYSVCTPNTPQALAHCSCLSGSHHAEVGVRLTRQAILQVIPSEGPQGTPVFRRERNAAPPFSTSCKNLTYMVRLFYGKNRENTTASNAGASAG